VDLWFHRVKRPSRSVPREKREPQAGPASCLSNSASKVLAASGDGVCIPEPKTETPDSGEGVEGLPGSESVARAEGGARNRGGPESPCRTNCEGQAGREAQRQEASPDAPGVGLAHSIPQQGVSSEAGEGANKSTQSAQATSAVRTTERDWPTFLRAIGFAWTPALGSHRRTGPSWPPWPCASNRPGSVGQRNRSPLPQPSVNASLDECYEGCLLRKRRSR
jgi:hypothetical protein